MYETLGKHRVLHPQRNASTSPACFGPLAHNGPREDSGISEDRVVPRLAEETCAKKRNRNVSQHCMRAAIFNRRLRTDLLGVKPSRAPYCQRQKLASLLECLLVDPVSLEAILHAGDRCLGGQADKAFHEVLPLLNRQCVEGRRRPHSKLSVELRRIEPTRLEPVCFNRVLNTSLRERFRPTTN